MSASATAHPQNALANLVLGPAMGLPEMLALAFRRRWRASAALLGPPALAVLLLFVLPPKYRAQSDIMVKTGREYLAQDGGAASLTAPTSTKQEGINSEIELLTSRAVIKATIAKVGLAELYPDLLESPPWFGTVEDAAIDKFNKNLTVEPVKLSNVINVSFDAGTPDKAQRVLDALVATYIDKHTQVFAGTRSDSYADAISRDLAEIERLEQDRTRIKLGAGIYDINAQRSALITQRVAAETHVQGVVDTATAMRARIASLEEGRGSTARSSKSTNSVPSDELVHAQQTLVDLRAAEAKMATHFGPSYPELQSVREQIAGLERRTASLHDRVNVSTAPSAVAQQIDTEVVMDRAQLSPLAAEQTRYEALLASLTTELRRLEQADLQLRTIGTQIDADNDNLKLEQARYSQARTQEQMDLARQVSVVQVAAADAPQSPAKPRALILLGGGILLGLLAGGGVVVLAIATSNTIVTEDGAERLLGLPVLLALPLGPQRSSPITLAMDGAPNWAAE